MTCATTWLSTCTTTRWVLVADETGDARRGSHTVGVHRQYTSTAGRIENSQFAHGLARTCSGGPEVVRSAFVDRPDRPDRPPPGSRIRPGHRVRRQALPRSSAPAQLVPPATTPQARSLANHCCRQAAAPAGSQSTAGAAGFGGRSQTRDKSDGDNVVGRYAETRMSFMVGALGLCTSGLGGDQVALGSRRKKQAGGCVTFEFFTHMDSVRGAGRLVPDVQSLMIRQGRIGQSAPRPTRRMRL